MLDPASIERLAESPEQNDPLLNVALAEEGGGAVLLALASWASLGADAIEVIFARMGREGDELVAVDEGASSSVVSALEEKLVALLNAPPAVRDAVLARHRADPFFVLSAAAHRDATAFALETAARWPSLSSLHDRPWILALRAAERDDALLRRWSTDDELLREAAAMLTRDASLLSVLARDGARRVRRAVATNPQGCDVRTSLATSDKAPEVRSRATSKSAATEPTFAACLRSLEAGGAIAHDVKKALLDAGPQLDEEGALLGARYLDKEELHALVAQTTGPDNDPLCPRGTGVGAGLGLRRPLEGDDNETILSNDIVHLVTRQSAETRLTGKARVALWIAQCLSHCHALPDAQFGQAIAPGTLAGDRMVLLRWGATTGRVPHPIADESASHVPAALLELLWCDRSFADEALVTLARRVAPMARESRELPEDELDLSPLARPLPIVERSVLAAIGRVAVSPRAALTAIALDPRRCRYVLSAMPTWKGTLTGARLARVLRSYAGALSAAARASSAPPPRPAVVARWTDRRLTEIEAAIAIAVGDLTGDELVRRLRGGSLRLQDGAALAAGVEARAAIEGRAAFSSLVDYAAAERTKDASMLALWMLVETLDRVRAASLIASAIDGLVVSGTVVAPAVCEALATLERRTPGRLESVHAQSPRGRATVASAIARAYRAFGGMRDEA